MARNVPSGSGRRTSRRSGPTARSYSQRTIADLAEHEEAVKVRSKARSIIGSVCATTAFGLLCPESSVSDLDKAIAEARGLADGFSTAAKLTRVRIYVLAGRIAADDVEAVRAINSEIRDLLAAMSEGIGNLDVRKVREAADRARDIGRMLAPDAQGRVQEAIAAARGAASAIVKAGDQAAQEIDLRAISRITAARTEFLDLDPAAEIAVPAAKARALDLNPAATPPAPM
jgi:hypothetical protein